MRILFSALLLMVWTLPVGASMAIDRSILHFQPGEPSRQDVTISNPGEDTLFVEVQVLSVSDPGTEQEVREPVRDPREAGFIATPNRLAIPAGSRRLVRMVNLNGHGEQEQVYRVNLTPVEAPRESEETARMGVRVLVGYQVLALVAPAQPRRELVSERQGEQLRFANRGNVNVLFSKGWRCPPGTESVDESLCEPVKGRRLYPGNQWQVPLAAGERLYFRYQTGEQRQRGWFD